MRLNSPLGLSATVDKDCKESKIYLEDAEAKDGCSELIMERAGTEWEVGEGAVAMGPEVEQAVAKRFSWE